MTSLIKSKKRVRDHGEVFTPNWIVQDMLKMVEQETVRIESRFLEPACGDGNFLVEVLKQKMESLKKYKRNQFEYERQAMLVVANIYGIDLLDDNVEKARERLYQTFLEIYQGVFKKKINEEYLKNIKFLLEKNILQGDALSLKTKTGEPILFSEWTAVNGTKIKRRDFIFEAIIPSESKNTLFDKKEYNDEGKEYFIPKPIKKEFPAVEFLNLYKAYDE